MFLLIRRPGSTTENLLDIAQQFTRRRYVYSNGQYHYTLGYTYYYEVAPVSKGYTCTYMRDSNSMCRNCHRRR